MCWLKPRSNGRLALCERTRPGERLMTYPSSILMRSIHSMFWCASLAKCRHMNISWIFMGRMCTRRICARQQWSYSFAAPTASKASSDAGSYLRCKSGTLSWRKCSNLMRKWLKRGLTRRDLTSLQPSRRPKRISRKRRAKRRAKSHISAYMPQDYSSRSRPSCKNRSM